MVGSIVNFGSGTITQAEFEKLKAAALGTGTPQTPTVE